MTGRTAGAAGFAGLGAALGWRLGLVLANCLGWGALILTVVLTVQFHSFYTALLVEALLFGLLLGLVVYRRQVATEVRRLLAPPAVPVAAPGCTYMVRDTHGTVVYDGSSGDVEDLLARLRAHLLVGSQRTAVTGRVRPGWSVLIEFQPDRAGAYRLEGQRIDARLGSPSYLNRRREGRR